MLTKLEKKYPLQIYLARQLSTRDLSRGLAFYANDGKFDHNVYIGIDTGAR